MENTRRKMENSKESKHEKTKNGKAIKLTIKALITK
jgi:hypothetical protein